MKKIFFAITFFLATFSFAQKFVAEASLPPVSKNGFYRVTITPEFVAYLNRGFTNIRIYDKQNHEVPYLTEEEVPVFSSTTFIEYPIIEKTNTPQCCTRIIFRNREKRPINNISLAIKNAETIKEATLLGSDDQKKWYALKEHFFLSAVQAPDKTYEVRVVDFPLSNYEFVALNINDSLTAPLNIIRAGFYQTSEVTGNYSPISPSQLTKTNSLKEKTTQLKLEFDSEKIIDKLEFEISGAPLYHRYADLYIPALTKNRKGKLVKSKEFIQTLEFTSTHQASYRINSIKTKEVNIEVKNEDNTPLKFSSVQALQLNRYLEAYLEQGEIYSIKIGDTNMPAPSYDIGYFRDSIPTNPPVIRADKLVVAASETPKSTTFFTSKKFIWGAIITVIAVLAYMSIKIVNESSAKEKS
ncbi:MAG: hypothetical protein HY015_08975 [Bacteroidetes bacterium]|nr:hypothetical protein [Bacteroidota bacterium]MBI3483087.1 hypothetical protein [Bacteroidota bacterium]